MFLDFQIKVTNSKTNGVRDDEITEGKKALKKEPKGERPAKRKAPASRASRTSGTHTAPAPPPSTAEQTGQTQAVGSSTTADA